MKEPDCPTARELKDYHEPVEQIDSQITMIF